MTRNTGGGSSATVRTRHLVEVRGYGLNDLPAVRALGTELFAAVSQNRPGAVIFADHRRGAPLCAQVASAWVHEFRRANGAFERSGILLDPSNAIFNLQLARIVQCAGNDSRRLFTDAAELYAWLSVSLGDDERRALQTMLFAT